MKSFGFMLAGLLLSLTVQAADSYSEGKEYKMLGREQPVSTDEKIEVLEFFWYACQHCYRLEPEVKAWLKTKADDVTFIRIPAILGPSWEILARAYFTADILGVLDKTHEAMFNHLHKARKRIRKVEELQAFFVEQGVSKEDFDKTFNSFAVVTRTNRARQANDRYQFSSVPTIIVNGKYITSPSETGGNANVFNVVNYLVDLERKNIEAKQKKSVVAK